MLNQKLILPVFVADLHAHSQLIVPLRVEIGVFLIIGERSLLLQEAPLLHLDALSRIMLRRKQLVVLCHIGVVAAHVEGAEAACGIALRVSHV